MMPWIQLTDHELQQLEHVVISTRHYEAAAAAFNGPGDSDKEAALLRLTDASAIRSAALHAFALAAPSIRLPTRVRWLGLRLAIALEATFAALGLGHEDGIRRSRQRAWWLAELLEGPQHPYDQERTAVEMMEGAHTPSPALVLQRLEERSLSDTS